MPSNRVVHKWTNRDREYLVLLKLRYIRKVIAPIFNHLLATTLRREGFGKGISAPALDAQYHEMKDGGKGHEIYAGIAGLSEARTEIEYRGHLKEIKDAARARSLTLERKRSPSRRVATHRVSRSRRVRSIRNKPPQRPVSSTFSPEVTTRERVTLARQKVFADKISPFFANNTAANTTSASPEAPSHVVNSSIVPPSLSINYDFSGNEARQRPLLLFRCDENPTNFRARRFRNPNTHVPRPEAFGSAAYREWAIHHLERCDIYASPFLSFAQKPRNAIRRVETARSENFDKKRFLVIFSFNDVEENAAQNFGPGAGPHLARMLFEGQVSDLPDGYTGAGEWLAHGFVDCEPLVVLDAAQVVNLARAIRRFKTGEIAALMEIRTCLQDVPLRWREAVAYSILRNYCGKKLPQVGTPPYNEMMDAIVNGGRTSVAELTEFSRLSVADADTDGEYQNEDDDQSEASVDMITPGQRLANSRETGSVPQPANTTLKPTAQTNLDLSLSTRSTVSNLNSFNTTSASANFRSETAESTPLWSPDRSEGPEPSQAISGPLPGEPAIPESPVSTTSIDEDNEWDFVNDELEASFVTSFPSAAKRTQMLHAAPPAPEATFIGFDDEEEEEETEMKEENTEEDFIMPSIETDRIRDDASLSGSRDNFLRGLTAHATRDTSESSVVETPSKPPRKVANVRTQTKDSAQVSFGCKNETTRANQGLSSNFNFNTPLRSITKKLPQSSVFGGKKSRPIDLSRLDPSTAQGTISMAKAPVSIGRTQNHKLNPPPNTTIRTKVPVIVRKTIIDD